MLSKSVPRGCPLTFVSIKQCIFLSFFNDLGCKTNGEFGMSIYPTVVVCSCFFLQKNPTRFTTIYTQQTKKQQHKTLINLNVQCVRLKIFQKSFQLNALIIKNMFLSKYKWRRLKTEYGHRNMVSEKK